MSMFMLNPSAPMTMVHLRHRSDERIHQPMDKFSQPSRQTMQPFTDGLLWPSSRFAGGGATSGWSGMLGQDAADMRRWGQELWEGGGVASAVKYVGVTQDSAGSTLAGATLTPFLTSNDAVAGPDVVSDAGGYFEACSIYPGVDHYVVAYKPGSPDVAGVSKNNVRFT